MKTRLILSLLCITVYIGNAQNVGVGTTSPTARLEVNKAVKADLKLKSSNYTDTTQLIFSNKNGTTGTDFIISSNQENGLRFSSSSDIPQNTKSNILEIKPNGRIGIATPSPDGKLQINHRATFTNPSLMLYDSSTSIGGGVIQFRNMAGLNKFNLLGSIGSATNGSDSYLDFHRNSFSLMTLRGDGNLGINNTNPEVRLDINGDGAIRNNAVLEFGRGISGKEINAGKIGYGVFGLPDVLSIVGGGQGPTLVRKIKLWAESGTTIGGPAFVEGNLAVGTTVVPSGYKMSVDGKIIAEELRIQNSTAWPDFVFKSDYKLPTLLDVKKHIENHHHLIDVPSAKEIDEKGIVVGEMQNVLLRKVEELTLYILDLQKQIDQLKATKND